MEYRLTWNRRATPSGRLYYLLRASARLTPDTEYSGWPTPDTNERGGPQYPAKRKAGGHAVTLQDAASSFTGWATPTSEDSERGANSKFNSLNQQAKLAGYPTPRANDAEKRGQIANDARSGLPGLVSGWATPTVPNGGQSIAHAEMIGGTCYHEGRKVQVGLEAQAKMVSGWSTPAAQDAKNGSAPPSQFNRNSEALPIQVHGMIGNSAISPTAKRGVLNPALSRWLMGYPEAWCECATRAHRSLKRKREP